MIPPPAVLLQAGTPKAHAGTDIAGNSTRSCYRLNLSCVVYAFSNKHACFLLPT